MNFDKIEARIKSFPPALILGVLLIITLIATFITQRAISTRHQERLKQLSERISNSILSRIERYERSLIHIHAFFKTNGHVSRSMFQSYVKDINLNINYPGIQGMGYTKRVRSHELLAYEKSVREEGFTDFKVWPTNPRDNYFSIHFLEPFEWRNRRAFGFDMFTQPRRQAAMIRAMETAKPSITSIVTLVQETSKKVQPGFLVYLALYSGGTIPNTVEERIKSFDGFIYAPFRAHDFFNGIFEDELATHKEVDVKIYDGDKLKDENLLYHNNLLFKDTIEGDSNISLTNQLTPNDHLWTMVTTYRNDLGLKLEQMLPWIVFTLGTIFSLMISWIFYAARKHAVEMEASLTRFNALVSNLTEGLIFVNPYGEVQFMNKVALEIYQFLRQEDFLISYKEFNDLFHFKTVDGLDIDDEARPIRRSLRGEKYSDYELELTHIPTNKKIFVSYGGTPIFDKRGNLALVVITAKNITEKKNTELALRNAISARDEFVSISSHELKTPLTSLKLKAQFFRRKLSQNHNMPLDEVERFAEGIDQQIGRLTRLVDDMLDISRLHSGKFKLSIEEVDFCELIKNALEQMKHQFIEAGYDVPSLTLPEKAIGQWDPLRIEQVINNLLTNAIRYGEKKPVSLEVKIIDKSVELSVIDHGEGISDEQKKRIFNRFERLTEVHKTTGLGLGLFLSQKIVKAHDGKIWVESELHQGSVFKFQLPLKAPDI